MPQVEIVIGGRTFEVACQEGEESYLQSASALLDAEASHLADQIGRMPEARMLLMAGLMLADRTAGLADKVKSLEAEAAKMRAEMETMQAEPVRVEVPVVPAAVTDALAEIAARAEALAEQVEAR